MSEQEGMNVAERKRQEFEKYRVDPDKKPEVKEEPPRVPGNKEEEPEEEKKEAKRCQRCGFVLDNELPQVDEEDRKEFVRALLGNRPFTKVYQLFDGQLEIKFHSLSTDKAEEMNRVIKQIDSEGMSMENWTTEVMKVRAVYYLEQFGDQVYTIPDWQEEPTLDQVLKAYDEMFGRDSEDRSALVMRALIQYVRYLPVLLDSGFDEVFWRGAGLV